MKTRYSVERVINVPADVVYRCLADYVHHHRPGGFLPPAFSNQEVLSGGIGDGTVIRLSVTLAGRTNTMTAHISEPEPGRVLVEHSQKVETTFTVQPEGHQSRVRFETVLEAGGLEGLFIRVLAARLLRPVYTDELQLLERYALSQVAQSGPERAISPASNDAWSGVTQ